MRVLALGLDATALGRVRGELEPAGIAFAAVAEPDQAAIAAAGVLVLGDGEWREQLAEVNATRPELAVVLVTGSPQSLRVTGALRNRRLFQAVRADFGAGELA